MTKILRYSLLSFKSLSSSCHLCEHHLYIRTEDFVSARPLLNYLSLRDTSVILTLVLSGPTLPIKS